MEVYTIILLSIVAPILVQIIKVLSSKLGWEINKQVITIIVAVVSIGAAALVDAPALPTYEDPMSFVGALITMAGSIFATATIFYNLLLDKIFELMGFVQESKKLN